MALSLCVPHPVAFGTLVLEMALESVARLVIKVIARSLGAKIAVGLVIVLK